MKKKIRMTTAEAREHYHCTAETLRRWHKEKREGIEVQVGPAKTRIYIRYEDVEDDTAANIPEPNRLDQIVALKLELEKYSDYDDEDNDLLRNHAKYNLQSAQRKLDTLLASGDAV